jgi:hypothetical protein
MNTYIPLAHGEICAAVLGLPSVFNVMGCFLLSLKFLLPQTARNYG